MRLQGVPGWGGAWGQWAEPKHPGDMGQCFGDTPRGGGDTRGRGSLSPLTLAAMTTVSLSTTSTKTSFLVPCAQMGGGGGVKAGRGTIGGHRDTGRVLPAPPGVAARGGWRPSWGLPCSAASQHRTAMTQGERQGLGTLAGLGRGFRGGFGVSLGPHQPNGAQVEKAEGFGGHGLRVHEVAQHLGCCCLDIAVVLGEPGGGVVTLHSWPMWPMGHPLPPPPLPRNCLLSPSLWGVPSGCSGVSPSSPELSSAPKGCPPLQGVSPAP